MKKMPIVLSKKLLRRYLLYRRDGSFKRLKTTGNGTAGTITKGALDARGYRRLRFLGDQCAFHRLVWAWHYGNTSKAIDHINGNKSDNRIQNLRLATPSQNAFNSKLFKNNTSGARGVYFLKRRDSWAASIQVNGIRVKLGESKDRAIIEARYYGAAKIAHGKFYCERT